MHNTIILYNTQQRLEKIMQITMNLPTIRENYRQNAAETRKLYAKYYNYTQKIKIYNNTQNTNYHIAKDTNFITIHQPQILPQCRRHKSYNNTQNTNFITMQKTQIL